MNHKASSWLLVLAVAACDPPVTTPPPPPTPPQVFLTVTETNVIGDAITGRVNVQGCKAVAQVQLLQGADNTFLLDINYTGAATAFTLPPGLFSNLYSRLGIAASLTLRAKVECDDARTNMSQPVGVKFFPIASKFSQAGMQVLPDTFVAEGGFGSTPTTFLGCVGTSTGTAIARIDTMGMPIDYNDQLPFNCTINTQISERSLATGVRWVLEPLQGAYAIGTDLLFRKVIRDVRTKRLGVGSDGDAVIWIDGEGTRNRIYYAKPDVSTTNDWEADFYGIMNAVPVINKGEEAVWVSSFQLTLETQGGSRRGDLVAYKHDRRNGALLNGIVQGAPPIIIRQSYSDFNEPIMPEASFSADGHFYVVPLLAVSGGGVNTTVLSCSTSLGSCDGAARQWTAPTVDGVLRQVVPFSAGNLYAAMGPYGVYFLNAQSGAIMNLGEQPLRPEGSLVVYGGQPGLGADFYVLTGPDFGGAPGYPTEIIATDSPGAGELYRFSSGSGESPVAGLWIAIDEAAQPWFRVGPDLVKPLPNTEYRNARGPTILP